jgi:hypothetical protein
MWDLKRGYRQQDCSNDADYIPQRLHKKVRKEQGADEEKKLGDEPTS